MFAVPPVSMPLPWQPAPAAFAATLAAPLVTGLPETPAASGSAPSMLTLRVKGLAAEDWRAAARVCSTRSVTDPSRSSTSASPEAKSRSTGSTAIRSSDDPLSAARRVCPLPGAKAHGAAAIGGQGGDRRESESQSGQGKTKVHGSPDTTSCVAGADGAKAKKKPG